MEISQVLEITEKSDDFMKLPRLKKKLATILDPMITFAPLQIFNDAFQLGECRFGNAPDLPKDFKWPLIDKRSAVCLAQINLTNVKNLAPELILPEKGWLYFFIESEWDPNAKLEPKCLVIHLTPV